MSIFSEMELQQVMHDEEQLTTSAKNGMNIQRMETKIPEEQQIKKALLKDNPLTNCLMEKICDRKNLNLAYKRVKANKGAPGIDGMTVDEMGQFIAEHKGRLLESLLEGSYQPQPVREVEIPKPGGGTRQLGIPTVIDRLVQQAIADLSDQLLRPAGYTGYFHFAEKKGYSGVGIYTKHQPQQVITGLGWPEADQEGRYIELDLGPICIASLYLPSGTSGEERQAIKFDFLDRYAKHLQRSMNPSKEIIICGDWNIAHRQIDLKNWRGNQKNSGFLPEERAWMDDLFGPLGFVDAFRHVNQEPEQYTWWSNRGQAWAKNVGWRIDYQVVTPGLKQAIQSVSIYKDQRFSDHAPLTIEYNL